jgi:hypothetical protein
MQFVRQFFAIIPHAGINDAKPDVAGIPRLRNAITVIELAPSLEESDE